MELRIMIEPQQGATYEDQLLMALHAEQLGFPAFARSDHLSRIGDGDLGPGATDSWVTLGALARETTSIRLVSMMTCATYRPPGLLAIQAAQVDAMSRGRLELGMGAGWFEPEHVQFGIPFPPLAERFERLSEQLDILLGIWTTPAGELFNYAGRHYELARCPALPKPMQMPRPPIILGGKGPKRTPRLAAKYADEFNIAFDNFESEAVQLQRVRDACAAIGRDPGTLTLSIAVTTAIGATKRESQVRIDRLGDDRARLEAGPGLVGCVERARERILAYSELGVSRLYLQMRDLNDLEQLDLVAEELLGSV